MYSFTSRVRYSEIDTSRCLTLHSILNYFQDCSTFQSEYLGVGIDYQTTHNRAWLLNSWQIIVTRYPSLGEEIEIGTWAYGFDHLYGYRNFIMKDQKGQVVAFANSIWFLIDTSNNRLTKVNTSDIEAYPLEERFPMHYAPRKMVPPTTATVYDSFPVIKSNIDTNNHVNNGEYIKMAQEFLPVGFIVHQMRAEYKKAAVLGDYITPLVSLEENLCTIQLADANHRPYAIIEFTRKQ